MSLLGFAWKNGLEASCRGINVSLKGPSESEERLIEWMVKDDHGGRGRVLRRRDNINSNQNGK